MKGIDGFDVMVTSGYLMILGGVTVVFGPGWGLIVGGLILMGLGIALAGGWLRARD